MAGPDEALARVATVVLDERVVRRVIKKHYRIPGIGLQVPHARCATLPRAALLALVEPDELSIAPDAVPDPVTILSASHSALAAGSVSAWSQVWRAVFHAQVHRAFDALLARGAITPALVRARIHRIGQTEFDEIRSVLRQEELLLPTGDRPDATGASDDVATYIEFVALYSELAAFAPRMLSRTFPTLDLAHVDAVIALDLDPQALLAASHPDGAPAAPILDPGSAPIATPAPAPAIHDRGARAQASRARVQGNRARAAILSLRAGDRDQARQDLDELGARLARALDCPAGTWTDALLPVAELAATQRVLRFTAGARLLLDLQMACVVAERETNVVDAVGWAMSLGKRPIVRALPATREVLVAKHVHAAAKKLAGIAPLSTASHERLSDALRDLGERANANVRRVLRPKLEAALDAVELHPHNLPERVAEKKLVDELLDQVEAVGQISLGHLRDAISHNELKMPDLRARELRDGDALLRCDRILSRELDGVYRRGESYLRFLQKISSVMFGTPIGRFLSLYIILPLVASFTAIKGLQEMIDLVAKHLHHAARDAAALPTFSPNTASVLHWISSVAHQTHRAAPEIATPTTILGGAVFLFLLLHLPLFRSATVAVLRLVGRVLRLVLLDGVRWVLRLPVVRRFLASRLVRWVIKPGIPPTLFLLITDGVVRWPVAAVGFLLLAIGLNSRLGRKAQEVIADGIVRSSRHLTTRLAPAAIRWILDIFAELMELVDRAIYRVYEWLRFKGGESRWKLVVKGVLGTIWGAIAWFLRLYINLFVEPCVNPIKHFPVVTVAAKLIVPFIEPLMIGIRDPASAVLGNALGTSFAAFTVFVIPGLAGFLVWELKENWKLYRKTRAPELSEVSIGHHGESMVGFLKPGFHSGTIPKRFTKLRRTAWKSDERGVAKHREALHHVEEAIHKFADRELVSMLNEAAPFRVTDVAVGAITIGSNRVQIELAAPSLGDTAVRIAFELQSGWILASIPARGWLDTLDADQRRIVEIALAGFYKRAGVGLVREQLERVLAGDGDAPPYDIADEGLIVWPGHGYQTEAVYDLRAPYPTPKLRGAAWHGELPSFHGQHALYAREPVRWALWTQAWEQLARGEEPTQLVTGPPLIAAPKS